MPYTAQATKEDLKRHKRKCWWVGCPYSAYFQDWKGWNWCSKHAIKFVQSSENNKWFSFKTLKIRNPY